jgi:5-formyltetrahydrofolate cyclo-ligase
MDSDTISNKKQKIREKIWKKMKDQKIERFPYAQGKVPNFKGAKRAALTLKSLKEFENAHTVFVAPDSPQKPVRELVLTQKKQLIMPTPKLKSQFLIVNPFPGKEKKESTIKGAFTYGDTIPIEKVPVIDLVVQGAVAVDYMGGRLGKGGGYGDKEISLLKTHKKMNGKIAVTVHDIQVVDPIPQNSWDLTVDIIVTPTRVIKTQPRKKEAVSKYMSYILRHHPPESMGENGFMVIDELVTMVKSQYNVDIQFVKTVVDTDSKGRFQIQGDTIRAVYGHSIPVSIGLPLAEISVLYHGTTQKAADRILKEGLKPRSRQKVHLSPSIEIAIEVGKRKCENPVILKIDCQKDKVIIEKASDSVYVADFIPPELISMKNQKGESTLQ